MKTLAASFVLALLAVQAPPPAPERPSRVVVVPIAGEIDARNVALVLRAAREILAGPKPDLVVFEIDTPGGRIDYMLAIGEAVMGLQPIPTVAYVRPLPAGPSLGALSAGAYIGMSAQRIYMHPGMVIGASAPVALGPGGAVELGEKTISAMREKFRARAEQNG